VLTTLSFRAVVGLAMITAWLYVGRRPRADARVRLISFATGVLFAALIFCLFEAIEAIDVPTAILTYFSYPLLTGLAQPQSVSNGCTGRVLFARSRPSADWR